MARRTLATKVAILQDLVRTWPEPEHAQAALALAGNGIPAFEKFSNPALAL